MNENNINSIKDEIKKEMKEFLVQKIEGIPKAKTQKDFQEMKKHIRDLMDIQEEIISSRKIQKP